MSDIVVTLQSYSGSPRQCIQIRKIHVVYRLKPERKLSIFAHNLFANLENPTDSMNKLLERRRIQ